MNAPADPETRPPARPTPQPLVTAVIVNYNSWPDVIRLVAALTAAPTVDSGACEVVVVDNGSYGPVPAEFRRPRAGVRLLPRRENGGFAAGVNDGWRASRSPWLLLLNPDVLLGPDQLDGIVARARRFEDAPSRAPGVVGFALRNAGGSPQPSVGVFPTLGRALREQLIPRSRRKYQAGWRVRPGIVDWVTGACMLVNSRLLDVLGGLDEEFFLYYEEVALCRTAHRLGWRVEFDPGIQATHFRPLQGRPVSHALRIVTRHSKLLYFRKHLPYRQFRCLSWLVSGEAGVRGLWARVRRKPEEVRVWRTVGDVSRMLRAGIVLSGREIRARAEEATASGSAFAPGGRGGRIGIPSRLGTEGPS